jgi:hypothetical protein
MAVVLVAAVIAIAFPPMVHGSLDRDWLPSLDAPRRAFIFSIIFIMA